MARILPLSNNVGGGVGPVMPRDKENGDTVNTTDKAGFLVLKSTGCGIRNNSGSDITIVVVMAMSDETNTSTRIVPANGEDVTVGLFNAVKVTGSTGHALSTTEYLLT